MKAEALPLVLGSLTGLGCCIVAIAIVLRSLKRFTKRKNALKLQLQNLNMEQAHKDGVRLQQVLTLFFQH